MQEATNNLYVVEKNIPMPETNSYTKWSFVSELSVGDSFVLTAKDYTSVAATFNKHGFAYRSRKIEDKPFDVALRRIWRTA